MKTFFKIQLLLIISLLILSSCNNDDDIVSQDKNKALENLNAEASIESVILSWNLPNQDVQAYIIKYNPGDVYLTIDDGQPNQVTIENLEAGIEHTFEVSWLDTSLNTSESVTVSSIPEVRPPGSFSGDLVFGNQSEIDEFQLSDEAALVNIDGNLTIQSDGSDDIVDISIFDNLNTITGNLVIKDNSLFSNLDTFQALENVEGNEIIIQNNRNLVNFCGLGNVSASINTTIDGNGFNPSQEEIFTNNCKTPDLVYDGFPRFNTQAEVDALPDGITHFPGELVIGLDAAANDITDLSKFSKLRRIEGRFIMQRTPLITDMSAFTSLEFIGNTDSDELVIRQMDNIVSLDGLQALTHVGRRIGIRENPSLQTLDGLNNIRFIGENKITIGACGNADQGNPLLTDYCALTGVVERFGVDVLEQSGSCIDSFSSFNPSFQDILDGNCSN